MSRKIGLVDFYDLLQVSPFASQRVIDAAYRAILRGSNTSDTQKIVDAYQFLSDSARREKYDEERMHLEGKVINGQYQIQSLIAQGAIGEVYKAVDLDVDEPVCIKHCSKISEEGAEILLDEVKALWNLRHYSLPAMRRLLKMKDGTTAIVMSYISGPTWAEVIEKNGAMHPEHVTWLAERILNALRFIHLQAGLIHGDVKPEKIILQPEKIMAVLVGFEFSLTKPDSNTRSKGFSEIFSSLEATEGMPLLPASDLYSLGMTMIYALNGDLEETKKRIVPESTPDPLCDFIKRLTVEDVRERPSWEDEDLCETLYDIKVKSFGKKSRIKPIPWQTPKQED